MTPTRRTFLAGILVGATQAWVAFGAATGDSADSDVAARATNARDDARARGAFMKAYQVFMHPRCQNCHPAGDTPLQGEDSHVHDLLRLRRGADGNGVFAM